MNEEQINKRPWLKELPERLDAIALTKRTQSNGVTLQTFDVNILEQFIIRLCKFESEL